MMRVQGDCFGILINRAVTLALAGALSVATVPAEAQTRFSWPGKTVDVGTYKTIEECLAAIGRVRVSEQRRQRLAAGWRDTLPRDPREELQPHPDSVVLTARRCAARYTEPSTALENYSSLLTVYLTANRDSDGAALLTRRLAALPATDAAARTAVENTALGIYRNARPFRRTAMQQIYEERLQRASDRWGRMVGHQRLAELARRALDTAAATAHAAQVIAEWERGSLTPAERRRGLEGGYGFGLNLLLYGLRRNELLDSLRRGTPSYVAALRNLLTPVAARLGADTAAPDLGMVGKPAPTVTADFWFHRGGRGGGGDSAAPRPTRGRVGLVVAIDPPEKGNGECLPVKDAQEDAFKDERCWAAFATLRRLGQRFPELEITLVVQTRGYFVYSALPDSARTEADLIRQWLHDVHRLPGSLAVQITKALRLPDPDRRRLLDHQADSAVTGSILPGSAFLVDRQGLVVDTGRIEPTSEAEFAEKIGILLQRQLAGP